MSGKWEPDRNKRIKALTTRENAAADTDLK